MIANNIFFSEKLVVIYWKEGNGTSQFCTLRRFKAFLFEFNLLFSRKSMFLVNTVSGQVREIGNKLFFLKN